MRQDRIRATEIAPSLVASDRSKNVAVYNSAGQRIGRIRRVMVDKATAKIVSAIICMGSGTPTIFGPDCHTVPWSLLVYNPRFDGYEMKIGSPKL